MNRREAERWLVRRPLQCPRVRDGAAQRACVVSAGCVRACGVRMSEAWIGRCFVCRGAGPPVLGIDF